MGTSLSTNAPIQRPTRYPPPISLLDFDPRKQTPPWVPRDRPDPHARFLEGYRGEEKEEGEERVMEGRRGKKTKRIDGRSGKDGTEDWKREGKEVKRKKLVDIDDDTHDLSADKQDGEDSDNEADDEDDEEKNNSQHQKQEGGSQSQSMYFRERYFERRQWAEQRDRHVHEGYYPYEQSGYAAGGRGYYEMLCEARGLGGGQGGMGDRRR